MDDEDRWRQQSMKNLNVANEALTRAKQLEKERDAWKAQFEIAARKKSLLMLCVGRDPKCQCEPCQRFRSIVDYA